MDKKIQNMTNELKDLVVGEETIYATLIFTIASFLFTTYVSLYITSIFPSIFTNIGLIGIGFILFVFGMILTKKYKN